MRLLVIRTSAMGDVALTTPVLKGFKEKYPDANLILLTRAEFKPFFSAIPGLTFVFPDFNARNNGISGLVRLFNEIKREGKIDYVIDLHDVLRSKILRFLFWLNSVPSSVIDKGRREKKLLITGKKKIRLKHTVERYCDAFARSGFPVQPSKDKWIVPSTYISLKDWYASETEGRLNIGVAPYAKHKLKMWPEDNMIKLLSLISEQHKCRFWLFGGIEDSEKLTALRTKIPFSTNLAGKISLEEELVFMSKLDLMIAMDSSNMHMAALVGTKVISIWGGTDPMSGFSAWMQPDNFSIRIPVEELDCRPCTIYGKGETKNDLKCMKMLTPEFVFRRIETLVLSKLD